MVNFLRAYVLVNTKPGTSEKVVKELRVKKKVKGILMADSVYGQYDAVVVMEVKDLKELMKTVYEVIEKNPNIVKTETLISLF
ncbi:Lrp/AsnC family transcriptional regulator [Candidatus Bathyarchaeota archaeon]|nr:MAG: Lrp/AsnC family transcriptional regulator [Candidatus Bathyarchaeota archaeon]